MPAPRHKEVGRVVHTRQRYQAPKALDLIEGRKPDVGVLLAVDSKAINIPIILDMAEYIDFVVSIVSSM